MHSLTVATAVPHQFKGTPLVATAEAILCCEHWDWDTENPDVMMPVYSVGG